MGWALDLWRNNALLALGLVLFLAGLGIPGPATVAVIATGALAKEGGISPVVALTIGLTCAAVGDLVSYGLARRGLGKWLERRKRSPSWRKAVARFEKNALLTLFLSRWLFTPISLPTTYIAGSSRFPIGRYLAASLLGQIVWIALYGSIGYVVGGRWQAVANQVGGYAGWIAGGVLLLGAGGYLLWRRQAAPHQVSERPE